MTYLLEVLVWQNSKDAQKRAPQNKPKPFIPEFMGIAPEGSEISKGIEIHTTDDIRDILALPRV